jgi:hypothetical protein
MATTTNVTEVIKSEGGKFLNHPKAEGYLRASRKFDELVNKGVTERRGHRLMTPDRAQTKICRFNAK